MGQLSSAPVSAREFARWFLEEYDNPAYPRASLDLLLSDAAGNQFQNNAIDRATFSNVQTAVLQWFQRGMSSPGNLLILFYCGHGLGKGKQTILLAEDFGSVQGPMSLNFAIDFDQFYLGMDQCAARQQCFFVDACRVGSLFAISTLNFFGHPLVPPSAKMAPTPRSAPVFYSAVPGATAYGRPGKTSFFTEALVNAFRGAGADDTTGNWIVSTGGGLHDGIYRYLQRSVSRTAAKGQLSLTDGISAPFNFHHLPGDPVVPVEVTCSPDSHNPSGALRVSGNGSLLTPSAPAEGPWDLDLPYGRYRFELGLPSAAAPLNPVEREIRPPYRRVEFLVP